MTNIDLTYLAEKMKQLQAKRTALTAADEEVVQAEQTARSKQQQQKQLRLDVEALEQEILWLTK